MSEKMTGPTFEGLYPPQLFREFAAECMELAQTSSTPEGKRALYLKMASVWHQMAQRCRSRSRRHSSAASALISFLEPICISFGPFPRSIRS
jgi:hypothetical protein